MVNNKILVLDGRSLATLAIVRSFGKKGYEVHCGESFSQNLTFYSKYVKNRIVYPPPKDKPEMFIEKIKSIIKDEKYELIVPVRDDATLLLSKYREEINEYTKIFLADYKKIKALNDKGETVKLAQKAGVPVPNTYFPEECVIEDIKNDIDYPILIRPRFGSGARGIKYVSSPEKFDSAFAETQKKHGTPIIQEYISHEGGHYSIGTLFDESSKEVATHVYVETKQYPINGGPAVSALSIDKPPWTKKMLKLLEYIGWVGPAHMDVLYDVSDQTPKLLEVNPRFWMSMNIAIQAGVDFPELLYKLSQGAKININSHYEDGLKYRWVVPNEVLWLTSTSNKVEGLRDFMNFWGKNVCYGTLSKKDPLPVFGAVEQGLSFFFDKEKRKQIFDRGW